MNQLALIVITLALIALQVTFVTATPGCLRFNCFSRKDRNPTKLQMNFCNDCDFFTKLEDYEETYGAFTEMLNKIQTQTDSKVNLIQQALVPTLFNKFYEIYDVAQSKYGKTFSTNTPDGKVVAQLIYDEYVRVRSKLVLDKIDPNVETKLWEFLRGQYDNNSQTFTLTWTTRPMHDHLFDYYIVTTVHQFGQTSSREPNFAAVLLNAVDVDLKQFFDNRESEDVISADNGSVESTAAIYNTFKAVKNVATIVDILSGMNPDDGHGKLFCPLFFHLAARVFAHIAKDDVALERKFHNVEKAAGEILVRLIFPENSD